MDMYILNNFCLEKIVKPVEHNSKVGKRERYVMYVGSNLLRDSLVSKFHPGSGLGGLGARSTEHSQLDILYLSFGHWPTHVARKGNCVVCLGWTQLEIAGM